MSFSSQPRDKKGTAASGRKLDIVCDHSVPLQKCPHCSKTKPAQNLTPQNEKAHVTKALEQIRKLMQNDTKAIEKAAKVLAFWISKK